MKILKMPIKTEKRSKKITLYITRHGKTVMNQQRLYQGSFDSPLNEIGIKATEALRDRIKEIAFDAVYVSPLGRTIETYNRLKNPNMPNLEVRQALREFDFGVIEGSSIDEAEFKWPEEIRSLYHDPRNQIPAKGMDSIVEFNKTVVTELYDLLDLHENSCILLVTHGVVMRSLMMEFEKRSIDDFWIDGYLPSNSLLIVEFDGNRFDILDRFNNDHIKAIEDV